MEFAFEFYGYSQRKWGRRECYLELDTFRTSICRLFDSSTLAFLPSTRMAIIVLNSLCLASKPGFISRLSVW